jgi:hypothetical protein
MVLAVIDLESRHHASVHSGYHQKYSIQGKFAKKKNSQFVNEAELEIKKQNKL